jgi:hypothetical protein
VSQTRPQEPTTDDRVRSTLATTDWRRMMFDLYRRVRATPDPQTAHALWRETRDAMFAEHPASPLLDEDARDFFGRGAGGKRDAEAVAGLGAASESEDGGHQQDDEDEAGFLGAQKAAKERGATFPDELDVSGLQGA